MLHHNKKRNVGLLNEFFARHIAKNIVDKDYEAVNKCKNLYKKHFSSDSELVKENYLFNILYSTTIKNKETAYSLIQKVKEHSKMFNEETLNKQKTKLINEINIELNDKTFFEHAVSDFRTQATIQTLLNSWREPKYIEDISMVAKLEDSLLEYVTSAKPIAQNDSLLEMTNEDIDALVVNLMVEKFNDKYASILSEEQRKLISYYVLSDYPSAKQSLAECLENLKTKTLYSIDKVNSSKRLGKEVLDEQMNKKLIGIKNLLQSNYKDTSKIDENTITFYMQITEMQKELEEDV